MTTGQTKVWVWFNRAALPLQIYLTILAHDRHDTFSAWVWAILAVLNADAWWKRKALEKGF